MTLVSLCALFAGSIAAGAINALAGGGSLVTLPILLALGLPPTTAAATNAVAAWSGLIGGAVGSRGLLAPHRRTLTAMAAVSGLGGILGGAALLATPSRLLAGLLPWLVLIGTFCLVAQPLLDRRFGRTAAWDLSATGDLFGWRGGVLFAVAMLTGYFNPCGGIAMVAAFAYFGIDDIRLANALKIVLGMVMTGASVVLFGAAGAVDWPIAGLMVAGTVIGGWFGARLALGIDRRLLRGLIIGWGGTMSVVFLVPT
jgi:uncharacterized membrane protein YfcA